MAARGRCRAGDHAAVRPLGNFAAALLAVLLVAPLANGQQNAATGAAALTDRGLAHAQAGRLQQAADLWRQALEQEPGYFPALFNLGYMHYDSDQPGEALPLLEMAAEVSPGAFNAHYLLGVVAQKLGRGDTALRSWRRALELQPAHSELMQVMAVEYGRGRYHREAADIARRALRLQPGVEQLYYLAIHACREAGDLAGGLEIASRAAARYPQSARASFELAWHLQRDGRFEEALPHLRLAIDLDPGYEEPHFFYGDWLVKQARYSEALEPLRRAITIRGDYMPARIGIARALMGQAKWQEALAELQEAVRVEPRHPQPHLLLSQVHFRLRDRAKARQEKELSLRLRRQNPTFLEAVQSRPFRD